MARIRVFHREPYDGNLTFDHARRQGPAVFRLVAIVNTPTEFTPYSINEAFRLTNTIDRPWHDNAGLEWRLRNQRSTSVGDVMSDGAGRLWLVAPAGFESYAPENFTTTDDLTNHLRQIEAALFDARVFLSKASVESSALRAPGSSDRDVLINDVRWAIVTASENANTALRKAVRLLEILQEVK